MERQALTLDFDRITVTIDSPGPEALTDLDTADTAGGPERPHDISRVHDGILGIEQRTGDFPIEQRNACEDIRGTETNRRDAERPLCFSAPPERLPLAFVERHVDCSRTPVVNQDARGAFEFGHEIRVEAEALQGQIGPCVTRFDLATGSQHSCSCPTGLASHGTGIYESNRKAGLRQSPRDGRTNNTCAGDHDIRGRGIHGKLPWYRRDRSGAGLACDSTLRILAERIERTHREDARLVARILGAVETHGSVQSKEIRVSGARRMTALNAVHATTGHHVTITIEHYINFFLLLVVVWKVGASGLELHHKETGEHPPGR